MIIKCSCRHTFQDQEYGNSMRLHNDCNKGFRCTVCGNVTASLKSEEKKDSKKTK